MTQQRSTRRSGTDGRQAPEPSDVRHAPRPRIASSRRCRASPSRPSARRRTSPRRSQAASHDRRMQQGAAHGRRWAGRRRRVEAYQPARPRTSSWSRSAQRPRGAPRPSRAASPRSATPAPRSSSSATSTTSLLYRELMRRGVSEYLVAPLGRCSSSSRHLRPLRRRRAPRRSAAPSPSSAPRAASAPRPSRTTSPGRSRADLRQRRVIVDLDLAFGTAGLDFNQDPPQGIADALVAPDRLDADLLDRLMSQCSRPAQPARRAGDARPRLRLSPRRASSRSLDDPARTDALRRARPAARLDGLDAAAP